VGRIRNARAWAAAAAAIAACVIAVSGCGGGGDDSASGTTGAAAIPTVTAPGQGQFRPPGNGSTSTTQTTPGNHPPTPGNLPPGARPVQQALAPFRDCLQRHGVSLPFLNGAGGQAQGRQFQQNPEQYRAQITKAFACIPELPPRLRAAAERLKRRYQQRRG
jgi:hypothetical protein